VLVKQTGVRRPVGIQDGDALSGHRLQRLDHLAHNAAHLVVGVGGGEDAGGQRLVGAGGDMEFGRERGQRGGDALVGARVAGEPGDDLQVGQGGKGLGERRLGACQVLWEIEQYRPQLCRGRGLFADQRRRCDEEVGGVVPPWLERGEGLAMKADNVLDEAGGGPEAREGGVGYVAQGRHRQAERTGCGGMPGNALEDSGVGV
jgi:hypothetical protein